MTDDYGAFINEGKSYLINTPFPPRSFFNVIANDDGYLTEISCWGTAQTSFQFADGEINTIVDGDRKTLYCRDDETGEVWCPGVYPMISGVSGYSCEHSDVFTRIISEYKDIRVKWRIFVPMTGGCEIWSVTAENMGSGSRKISVVPAVQLLLTGFAAKRFFDEQVQYSVCAFNAEINGMYYRAGNPSPKNKRYNAVLAANAPVVSFSGSGESFLGAPLAFQYPERLLNRGRLGCEKGLAGIPFQALQCSADIGPGGAVTFDFMLGVVDSEEHAAEAVKQIKDNAAAESLFERTRAAAQKRRDRLTVDTPDKRLNYFVNLWLKKGLEYGMRKKDATRDNFQFADGLCMSDPERVKKEILRDLSWQYRDGHTLRSWVPPDETRYCDGALWIVLTVCGYLKFTDDLDLLYINAPYFDGGAGTVLEHLCAGVSEADQNRGPHNLPLARFADWNDALNFLDDNAESVFMAMGLALMFGEMARLMRYIGEGGEAEAYEKKRAALKETINDAAWDEAGGYYAAAFAYGETIGATGSRGSTLYINPQTWSIIAGVVTPERLPRVLKTIDERIESDLGCPVNLPPFEAYDKDFGRISAQLPGTWENGSSYCHVTSFKAYADTLAGRGDKALESLLKVFPGHALNPISNSGATPFALTSSFSTNPEIYGKAGRPWLTGTQAWAMRAIVEGLLGVRRAYGGFEFSPSFPAAWGSAGCRVVGGGKVYDFRITRGRDGIEAALNGKKIEPGFIPF